MTENVTENDTNLSDKTASELAAIAVSDSRRLFSESSQLLEPQDLDDEAAAAVSSWETDTKPTGRVDTNGEEIVETIHRIKFWNKSQALMELSKHIELNGAIGGGANDADSEQRSLNEIGRTLAFALQQGLVEKSRRKQKTYRRAK